MTEKQEHTKLESAELDAGYEDEAAITLQHIATGDMGPITEEESHKVLRKIDFWLMPIMIITYALQYYDKGVYNQASLFGFLTDLDLSVVVKAGPPPVVSTLRYSQASMIFYCGYVAGVYPCTLIAQKFREGRVCGIFVFLWGICEICTVACKSFPGILIQRFFLGVLEGGIGPVFAIVCSQFYKRDEMALRVGLWFSAQPLSNTFAPLISYGFGTIKGPLAGWQNIYLFSGACTIAWGIFVFFFLPDDPTRARIFNDRERYVALERVRENNAGVVNHHIKWSHIKEALFDPVTWLYVTMIFAAITPNGVFGTFGSIIIKGLGFNTLQSLGIQAPSGFIGFLSEIIPMYIIRRTNNYRFHLITLFEVIVIIGGILLWASPKTNIPALLADLMSCFAGMFCLAIVTAVNNTAGHTKKSTMSALIVVGYSLGNIMAPLIFISTQAPGYVGGFTGITICTIYGAIVSQLIRWILVRRNRKRQELYGDPTVGNAFTDKTDKMNTNFRYLL